MLGGDAYPAVGDGDLYLAVVIPGVVGVHPSALGIVTSLQVFEAVSLIIGQEPKLLNKLLYIDLGDMKFHTLNISPSENCPVCGANPADSPEPIEDRFFEETCARDGRRNFIISPKERIEIDLKQLRMILNERGLPIKTSGQLGISFEQSENIQTSILKSGIMIIQTAPKFKNNYKTDALEIYRSILVEGLGLSNSIMPEE